jgi:hypothetical protein
MEAMAEQGTLFPLVDQVAGERSFLRQFMDAVEEHGPLVFRAHVPLILDVTRQRVHELIEKDQLVTVMVRQHEFVPVAALEAYFAREEKFGVKRNFERKMLRRLTSLQTQKKAS